MCNNDNCEKKIEDMKVILDGCLDVTDDTVTIPREEYDELIAESTILRVIEKLAESTMYSGDVLANIRAVLSIGKSEPEPGIESASSADKGDAE